MINFKKLGKTALKGVAEKLVEAAEYVEEKLAEEEVTPTNPAAEPPIEERTEDRFDLGDERKAAQLFGATSCPWSGRSRRVLERAEIDFSWVDLDLPGSSPIREELIQTTGKRTVPWIFLRGAFIGGFEALDEIERLGELERRCSPEHASTPETKTRIEIAKRDN